MKHRIEVDSRDMPPLVIQMPLSELTTDMHDCLPSPQFSPATITQNGYYVNLFAGFVT